MGGWRGAVECADADIDPTIRATTIPPPAPASVVYRV
jgi:hypothetical protein